MSLGDILGVGLGPTGTQAPGGGLVCYPIEVFATPLLDLTKTVAGLEVIPARTGLIPLIHVTALAVIETRTGTQTTPAQMNAGNDAAHVNFLAVSTNFPSNASVNGNTPPFYSNSVAVVPATTVRRVAGAPVLLDITSGAQGTGGFSLFGRICFSVYWWPVNP